MNGQLALDLFYVAWLIAVIVLLVLIFRSSQKRLHHVEAMEKALIDESAQALKTTQKAVDAAYLLAEKINPKGQSK